MGHPTLPAVAHNIERQAEHHKKISFQDEFASFLRKNGIPFDPVHLWE